MRGFRTKRGRAWSGVVRAGSVGHCPGRRHDRSLRLTLGQMRRMASEPEESEAVPALAAPADEPWGLLLYFPSVQAPA